MLYGSKILKLKIPHLMVGVLKVFRRSLKLVKYFKIYKTYFADWEIIKKKTKRLMLRGCSFKIFWNTWANYKMSCSKIYKIKQKLVFICEILQDKILALF